MEEGDGDSPLTIQVIAPANGNPSEPILVQLPPDLKYPKGMVVRFYELDKILVK